MKRIALAIIVLGIMATVVIGISACSEMMDFVTTQNAQAMELLNANIK